MLELRFPAYESIGVGWNPDSCVLELLLYQEQFPSITERLLEELIDYQDRLTEQLNDYSKQLPLIVQVLKSAYRSIFSYGGDLELMHECAITRDRDRLVSYLRKAVEVMRRTHLGYDGRVLTVCFASGLVLGGGFEAALSHHVLIVETGSSFSFPEYTLGMSPLFAHRLLNQASPGRSAGSMAEFMMAERHTAEALRDMGIVYAITPRNDSRALDSFIRTTQRKTEFFRHFLIEHAQITSPSMHGDSVEDWTDLLLALPPSRLRMMKRIHAAQVEAFQTM